MIKKPTRLSKSNNKELQKILKETEKEIQQNKDIIKYNLRV